jgi:hypothetical protein
LILKSTIIMKKVKIMLLSLALFAVVGGALAFKAKFSNKYCVTFTIKNAQGQPACDLVNPQACAFQDAVTTTAGVGLRLCTTATNGNAAAPCTGITTCTTLSKIVND